MSTSRFTLFFLVFTTSLIAQLPDYFEFVHEWSGYEVLDVHPFQGGMIYALASDLAERPDDAIIIHIREDGSHQELEFNLANVLEIEFETVNDSLVLFYTVANWECDIALGDGIYSYDGIEVSQVGMLGELLMDATFHPSGDSIYVFDSSIRVYTTKGELVRELDRILTTYDLIETFFHHNGVFYGVTIDGDIINAVTGETIFTGYGFIFDLKLFGDELLIVADQVLLFEDPFKYHTTIIKDGNSDRKFFEIRSEERYLVIAREAYIFDGLIIQVFALRDYTCIPIWFQIS